MEIDGAEKFQRGVFLLKTMRNMFKVKQVHVAYNDVTFDFRLHRIVYNLPLTTNNSLTYYHILLYDTVFSSLFLCAFLNCKKYFQERACGHFDII